MARFKWQVTSVNLRATGCGGGMEMEAPQPTLPVPAGRNDTTYWMESDLPEGEWHLVAVEGGRGWWQRLLVEGYDPGGC